LTRSWASGLYGAMNLPSAASSTRSDTSTTPTTTSRRAKKRRTAFRKNERGRSARRAGCRSTPGSALSMAKPNAWIERAVQEIDDDVGQHDARAGEEHQRLQHEILAPRDGVHHQPAETRDGEDRLGDHGPAEDVAELEAHDGEHR